MKANGGSAGVDGVSLEEVERQGVALFLEAIAGDLKAGRYKPQPVLRVYIPKPDGRQRPLGVPTVRDRIVQQACRIVIEPIFEANFQDHSYGFRPKRSAAQAVRAIDKVLLRGWWVVDADIQGYFDAIDHDLLLTLVRIVCAGRLTTGGDKRTTEPPVHTGVLEMACCERATDLGREHSSDASLPLVTAQYKGNRNLGRSDEDSAGHVVPFEGTGQQNPC